jgi:pimeloyl-ACP methyl ester carboxylesterase
MIETPSLSTTGSVAGNGLRLRYHEWGSEASAHGQAAVPLVCLHGIGGDADDWDEVARAFAGERRVIALDARGHGDSEWSPTADYSTDAHFADLACALEALGIERCVLAGYSMGGGVAILAAHALADRVERLVVVDTYPGPQMTEGSRRIAGFIAQGPWLKDGRPRFDPAISAAFARDLEAGEPRRLDLWPHWDALECPTLLVRATESRVLPESVALEMQSRLPHTQLVTLEGATHGVLRHSAQALTEAMATFLEG